MNEKCQAVIKFADDFGDNEATFHCQLPLGHEGPHEEKGVMYETLPYTLQWTGDMTNDEDEEVDL